MRLAFVLFFVSVAAAQPAPDIERILSRVATYQYGDDREALSQLRAVLESALPSPSRLKTLEARLIKFLQSNATPAGKNFALRELSFIGSADSVAFVSGLLTTPETAEIALYTLTRIPGPESGDALRKAIARTSGRVRIGVINALGQRRDAGSVVLLQPMLASSERDTAEAVMAALAEIGNQPALAALAAARQTASGERRERLSEAYLHAGRRLGSLEVYRQLLGSEESVRIRVAALGNLAEADPRGSRPALATALQSKTPALEAAAIRYLSGMPGADLTTQLVDQFPKLGPDSQMKLLSALADRGDVAARPLFLTAAKTATGDTRLAALAGLGRLGDGSSVTLLAGAAAAGQGDEQTIARTALYRLTGAGIDRSIVDAIGTTSGKDKVELIMAAGERVISSAAEALIAGVADTNPDVHRESLRALRNVAGAPHIPALLRLLDQSTGAADRREITLTLASVLRRSESSSVDGVIRAYQSSTSLPSRLALLEVMGQTASPAALPVLRASLADPSTDIVRGTVLALTEWNDPSPLPDLLAVAKGTNPTLSVLALRGYLKVMATPSQRTAAESARMLGEAMGLAKQPAEKRSALSLLASFPSKEALQVAEAALKDDAVAKEAKLAVDRLNGLLKFQ